MIHIFFQLQIQEHVAQNPFQIVLGNFSIFYGDLYIYIQKVYIPHPVGIGLNRVDPYLFLSYKSKSMLLKTLSRSFWVTFLSFMGTYIYIYIQTVYIPHPVGIGLCVYLCICMYVYIYICKYIYTYLCIYIYTFRLT